MAWDLPRLRIYQRILLAALVCMSGVWAAAQDRPPFDLNVPALPASPEPAFAVSGPVSEPTAPPGVPAAESDLDGLGICSPEPSPLFLGYDRGFVVAHGGQTTADGDAFPFLMRINSWFQLRSTQFDSNGPNADQNTISFERLRLALSGHAFSPDLQYFMQLDGNSDRLTDAAFLDYYASYDVGHALWGMDADRFGLRGGQWKVPFSRSREESGRRLQFTDRAIANVFFDLNRSLGFGVYGTLDTPNRPVHFETALFNGARSSGISTNRDGGLDQRLAWSGRVYSDFGSDFGNDGEPDLSWHELPAFRLGAATAYVPKEREGLLEFLRPRVVDSGVTLSSLLPNSIEGYDIWYFTVDGHLKYHGLSVLVDYYWRNIGNFRGGSVADLGDQGLVLQAGYFIWPQRLELLTRWSRITGDSGTLGLIEESADEVAGGVAWYFSGNNAKLVWDVTRINGVPILEPRLDMLPGDAGWLYRTQLQVAF